MRILDDKIPSFNSLVEAVREDSQLRDALLVDAAGTPITDGKNQGWWLNSMVIMPLLNVYVQRVGGFNYDEAIFDELFAVVQNDIESTEITITQLSPLMNVEIESEQIQIDTNVRLRQLSTDELEEWLNANTQFSFEPISPMELLNLKSAVEVVYQQKRHSMGVSPDAQDKVLRLLSAIRLFTDASPRLTFTKIRTSSLLTSGFGTTWGALTLRFGSLAKIEQSQESGLVELYKRLSSGPNLTGTIQAVTRWNSAIDRLTEEDKLIDYWIALESLFVPDTTQELSYRSALRIASFLGVNGIQRKQIYEEVKESYSLRSEIVHGSIGKRKRKLTSPELINLTRSFLRQSLLKILGSSDRFEPSMFEIQLLLKD
jgi:hypothetical protein